MANELTISASMQFAKGTFASMLRNYSNVLRDVAGEDATHGTQLIGATEEAIVITDIATPGYMLVKNLDATNFVSIRPGTGAANCIKLMPGDIAIFRCAIAPWAIADTAACRIEYYCVEN